MSKKNISLKDFHIPRWKELPNVDLYLDQVVSFVNSCLSPYIYFNNDLKKDDSSLLTKTMINNYVKNNIIEPPVKKQYSRTQIAKIFVICVLKQVYSMSEIVTLIEIALRDSTLQKSYDMFCSLFEKALLCTYRRKDFIDNNSSSDNIYLLKSVLLSCSYKIYVQNIISGNSQIPRPEGLDI